MPVEAVGAVPVAVEAAGAVLEGVEVVLEAVGAVPVGVEVVQAAEAVVQATQSLQ